MGLGILDQFVHGKARRLMCCSAAQDAINGHGHVGVRVVDGTRLPIGIDRRLGRLDDSELASSRRRGFTRAISIGTRLRRWEVATLRMLRGYGLQVSLGSKGTIVCWL